MRHAFLQACVCHGQKNFKAHVSLPISCYRKLFIRSDHTALAPVQASRHDVVRVGYVNCIRQCGHNSLLCKGMIIHFILIENGDDKDILVVNLVMEMYGKCKAPHDAYATFDKLEGRNVFSWTIMIGAYAHSGLEKEALKLFRSMEPAGVPPNRVTFITIISVCASLGDLSEGKLIHSLAEVGPFILDDRVGNALIHMYDKCGSIEDACLVFDKMPEHIVITWNALIAAHAKRGHGKALQFFSQMQLENVLPDHVTFVNALDLFDSKSRLHDCKRMHAQVVGVVGFNPDIVLGTTMLCAYAKCGSIEHAFLLFNDLPHDSTILWNAILGAHEEQGKESEALQLYQQMLQENVIPDKVSFITIFSTCASSDGLPEGRRLHACALFTSFDWVMIFWNALVNMYGKGGDLREALNTLDEAPTCDDSSWNALISAHAQHSEEERAIQLFQEMQMQCVIPTKVTFVSLLDACGKKGEIGEGKHVHARVLSSGYEKDMLEDRLRKVKFVINSDLSGDHLLDIQCSKNQRCTEESNSTRNCAVGNALVTMYSKCGSLDDAQMVFDNMQKRDVISWTAIIAAYAQEGQGDAAFRLFFQMQDEGVDPNNVTFISILDAFADRASLAEGQIFHFYLVTIDYEIDMEVGNPAMAMYSNCGCLEDAQRVFDRMRTKNSDSWTTLISLYSHYGMGRKAHSLYLEMQEAAVVPTPVTFLSVLSACSHAGLFEEGCRCFDSITELYGLSPNLEHYNCMVDLFARAGKLEEGIRMIQRMPSSPTSTTWMTLLGACKMHQNVENSLLIAEKIFELEPKSATPYVLLYNIFSAAGRCDDAEQIKTVMISKGLNKPLIDICTDSLFNG